MARYIVKGVKVLGLGETDPVTDNGALIVNGDVIEAVGKESALSLKGPFDSVLGGPDFVVMPGLNNAHYHCGPGNTVRVGALDGRLEPWRLVILGALMSPAEGESAKDAMRAATQYFGCGLIRAGITSCLDFMHVQPAMEDYGIGVVAKAYADLGLRASITLGANNQCAFVYDEDDNFLATLPPLLAKHARESALAKSYVDEDEYVSVLKSAHRKYDGSGAGRLRIFLSPYAPQWSTDSLLRKVKETASELRTGIQLHLLETRYQMQYALRAYGKTAIAHLAEIGFLGKEVSCAHAVWITDRDIEILRDTDTLCVHNPLSNLRLGSGIARVQDLLRAGVRVALGTDGMGFSNDNDMLNQLRLADYLQRLPQPDEEFIGPRQWLRLATAGGAQAIGLGDSWGTLEVGKKADFLLVDTRRMGEIGMDMNAIEQILLQYTTPDDIRTVVINGAVVMQDGRVLTVDERALARYIKGEFKAMSDHFKAKVPQMRELVPYVNAYFSGWDDEKLTPAYQYNTR